MPHMLPDHKADIQGGNEYADCRKSEKKVILIVNYNIACQKFLNQVYPVLDHYCTQSGQYSNDHTQDHDEVSLADILNPPA